MGNEVCISTDETSKQIKDYDRNIVNDVLVQMLDKALDKIFKAREEPHDALNKELPSRSSRGKNQSCQC